MSCTLQIKINYMEALHPDIRNFIAGYCIKYKISPVAPDELTLDTSIDLDLDISDIEIELFLAEFSEHFNIDNSKFSWYKYGYPKGSVSVKLLRAVFGYRHRWVRQLSYRIYKPRYRISNLQQAVKTGKLL